MQNKPELFFGNALFLNAWFELDQERERPKPITRSMCFGYALDYELDIDQRDELWLHINDMDSEFMVWWNKRQSRNKGPKPKRGKP